MPLTSHVITIDSSDRNTGSYPSPASYQISLPRRYRNIQQAQLISISFPEITPAQNVIFLKIDDLNSIDSTSPSGGVNFCFAKVPVLAPYANVHYADTNLVMFPPTILQNPIASLEKLVISITNSNGVPVTVGNHSLQLELVCGDYINNGGGSTLTQHGRILGGSR
jgi:hypothetical protein